VAVVRVVVVTVPGMPLGVVGAMRVVVTRFVAAVRGVVVVRVSAVLHDQCLLLIGSGRHAV
jgi:hypothetical protein